ncbi:MULTISPECIES: hypothetical protein [unclassified Pseudomonas]|jgi:hypothetical protein|uniref:hypothetical protein n=1 Tax=Pseudomonas TaxID=286 RepID=UPI0006D42186|nr:MULTISPECIES: hypothetical protein [unclassified Pseudomonas]AXQ48737.1 hypothetical protein DZC31_17315 [Stenotrophomonas rhizophila]MBS3185931.1 hypothetical protein [Pseudomonas sp. PCH44]PIK80118.1 hypothetical protein CQW31_00045 [Pseudomonas sp. 382]
MRKYLTVAIALLAPLVLCACSTPGTAKPPSETANTAPRYLKSDLYGVWYSNADDGTSQALALLLLRADGSATDFLILSEKNSMQKIVQQSSWSFDAEHNRFEQTVSEVSIQKGKAPAEVTHPHEVIRASVELVKLDNKVMGIKFKRDDGEVTGYLKGSAAMLEKLKHIQ